MIDISSVSWTYPHADAPSLRNIDLQITHGQFIVLCGASGSGKSTLLRLINGLVPHFHDDGELNGSVRVDELVTVEAEIDDLGLITGTVLQHPRRQFFTDTAREEAAFAMENFGFPREEIRQRVESTIVDLAERVPVEQRLQHLSGGQQQQVAIAAAVAHAPRILLLDEPSSNLSHEAIGRLATTLAEHKAAGATIVVAEHRLRYLQELIDRVIVMRDGMIGIEWSAEQFRAVPDDLLANEGLRGENRSPDPPVLAAAGDSIALPASAEDVPSANLELENIHCHLGGRSILDIARAGFAAGEITAIRGVNGAGKSTLARVITGLQRSSGRVRLNGQSLSRGARQRVSAIVMQDVQRQLFTESVHTEIELAGIDAPAAPDTAAVLNALDLGHLADRHPLSLSGGQQQRLVVAAARVADRRVVIFDEPSSGVDRRHLQSVSDQIRQVAAAGAVVLLISHDDDLIALAADRQLTLTPPVPASATSSASTATAPDHTPKGIQ